MLTRVLSILAAGVLALPALAADVTTYTSDSDFADTAFGLESAIVGRGLVIDYVSHTGEMLRRTGEDVGSGVKLFEQADIYLFCSALLSREVMEDDPMNIGYCPYGIFVAERDGAVMVGFRNYPDGAMQKIQALLDEIAREAAGQ